MGLFVRDLGNRVTKLNKKSLFLGALMTMENLIVNLYNYFKKQIETWLFISACASLVYFRLQERKESTFSGTLYGTKRTNK